MTHNYKFEYAFFQWLYDLYDLKSREKMLIEAGIPTLLEKNCEFSNISSYFRFMNDISIVKLPFWDRRHIQKNFTEKANIKFLIKSKRVIRIFNKIVKAVEHRPKGYISYSYDGKATNCSSNSVINNLGENLAPANYITFGIYYKQFSQAAEQKTNDMFYCHNCVADILNDIASSYKIATVMFSEVDLLRKKAVVL